MNGINSSRLFKGPGAFNLNFTNNGGVFLGNRLIASITRRSDFFDIALEGDTELSDVHGMARNFGRKLYSVSAFCAIVISVNQHGHPVVNIYPQPRLVD